MRAPPQLAAKYDGDQRTSFQYFLSMESSGSGKLRFNLSRRLAVPYILALKGEVLRHDVVVALAQVVAHPNELNSYEVSLNPTNNNISLPVTDWRDDLLFFPSESAGRNRQATVTQLF